MDNTEILNKLQNQICEVVFEKRDGSHRHMICTLKNDLLPSVTEVKESVRTTDYIPVFDLEEQAWRAFKPSKMISIEATPE